MKAVTTIVLLIALGAVVLAKPTRVERQGHALAHADVRISVVGATLEERAYFPSVVAAGQLWRFSLPFGSRPCSTRRA